MIFDKIFQKACDKNRHCKLQEIQTLISHDFTCFIVLKRVSIFQNHVKYVHHIFIKI